MTITEESSTVNEVTPVTVNKSKEKLTKSDTFKLKAQQNSPLKTSTDDDILKQSVASSPDNVYLTAINEDNDGLDSDIGKVVNTPETTKDDQETKRI